MQSCRSCFVSGSCFYDFEQTISPVVFLSDGEGASRFKWHLNIFDNFVCDEFELGRTVFGNHDANFIITAQTWCLLTSLVPADCPLTFSEEVVVVASSSTAAPGLFSIPLEGDAAGPSDRRMKPMKLMEQGG